MTKEFNQPVVGTITLAEVLCRVKSVMTGQVMRATYKGADYLKGIGYAGEMDYLTVAINNVWGGQAKNGGCVSSYEKIGYHAGTADFMAGAVLAGCPVFAYGDDGWRKVI